MATVMWQSESEKGFYIGVEIAADQIKNLKSSNALLPARPKRSANISRHALMLLLGTITVGFALWVSGWLPIDRLVPLGEVLMGNLSLDG